MAESKRRRYLTKATFGDSAPPNTIRFPRQASMTVTEILSFLPNSINCPDVIYRMISNGGTRKSIHAIINTHRDFEVEWSANCCGEAMYRTMNKGGYPDWTIKKHGLWHDSKKGSWDEKRLDVGSLRTLPKLPADTVSFKSLADHLRTMPEGDDALDLTKMVRYCMQNDGEDWLYPDDYEELLELLGGPAEVRNENTDGAVFDRWEHTKPPPPTKKTTQVFELFEGYKRTEEQSSKEIKSTNMSAGVDLLAERKVTCKKPRIYAEHAVSKEVERIWQSGDEGEVYARRPVSTDTDREIGLESMALTVDQAEYIPPPPIHAETCAEPTLTQVFQAEGFAGESDSYSAYAFRGPRSAPPYRLLHQITQPHPWDISGWAENLRWAFEQRILFAQEHRETVGWNESPKHMVLIERERTQRVWASDELLDVLGSD